MKQVPLSSVSLPPSFFSHDPPHGMLSPFFLCLFKSCLQSESENHSVVSNSLRPHRLYNLWNSPGQNTGVGSLSLPRGIFPTQGFNPGLPHCRQILYQLTHKGSPLSSRRSSNFTSLMKPDLMIQTPHDFLIAVISMWQTHVTLFHCAFLEPKLDRTLRTLRSWLTQYSFLKLKKSSSRIVLTFPVMDQ